MSKLKKYPKKFLVRCPNWIGDAVMVTPFLKKLRETYPDSQITCLCKQYVLEVFSGIPWVDDFITLDSAKRGAGFFDKIVPTIKNIKKIRNGKFDAVIFLTNSFEAALVGMLAGIPYRLGYRRDGRTWLLSDGPYPNKKSGSYVPCSMIGYYNKLGEYLGFDGFYEEMELFVTKKEDLSADEVLTNLGIFSRDRVVGLNPGGAFGASKFWPVKYFAEVGDYFASAGYKIILFAGPGEENIVDDIEANMKHSCVKSTPDKVSIGIAKAIVKRLSLLVTNDTGPRHFASAFGVPSVVVIGSTNPEWTRNNDKKQVVIGKTPMCGPCHIRVCPYNHQCMKSIKPSDVITTANELLKQYSSEKLLK